MKDKKYVLHYYIFKQGTKPGIEMKNVKIIYSIFIPCNKSFFSSKTRKLIKEFIEEILCFDNRVSYRCIKNRKKLICLNILDDYLILVPEGLIHNKRIQDDFKYDLQQIKKGEYPNVLDYLFEEYHYQNRNKLEKLENKSLL